MDCYIYRCSTRADMYLYLRERDDFACLPDELAKRLGKVEFALQLELHASKKLARENPATVIANLQKQGFHLQMPGEVAVDELLARIAAEANAASQKD